MLIKIAIKISLKLLEMIDSIVIKFIENEIAMILASNFSNVSESSKIQSVSIRLSFFQMFERSKCVR